MSLTEVEVAFESFPVDEVVFELELVDILPGRNWGDMAPKLWNAGKDWVLCDGESRLDERET